MPEVFQIAIDGPAASGKSTVAQLLAVRLGGVYVSTGEMYRAVTWAALGRGIDPASEPDRVAALLDELQLESFVAAGGRLGLRLDGLEIDPTVLRSPAVSHHVSDVARLPVVRNWLIERQRETRDLGIVVLEGRDIGTVIFPRARFKYFVTATPEERARRRLAQGGEAPEGASVETVAKEIARRDRIDSSRAVAPLRPADDAETIRTDGMTAEDVVDHILARAQDLEG